MECSRERCRGERINLYRVLRASLQEASEDHLGVAFIQPGDSVIIINEIFLKIYVTSKCTVCADERADWHIFMPVQLR